MRTTEHPIKGLTYTITNKGKVKVNEEDLMVRITSDEIGLSLSISDDKSRMYLIPLEPILKRLREIVNEQIH